MSNQESSPTAPESAENAPATGAIEDIDLLAAGRLLGLGRKRLIKWAKLGRLPGRREGFEWYFTREALLQFAYDNCLECGQPHLTIDEHVYFCPHCASSFAPYLVETEIQWLSPMRQANQQLFLQRLQHKALRDEEAIEQLCQRYQIQRLMAYKIWYEFQYGKTGTHRVGLGDVEFDGFLDE